MRTRTSNLLIRSQVLYPIELRVQSCSGFPESEAELSAAPEAMQEENSLFLKDSLFPQGFDKKVVSTPGASTGT